MAIITRSILFLAFSAVFSFANAASLTVAPEGADHTTIQAAIDAAANGDTVVVKDGTYSGEGNVNIDCNGKAITIRSESGYRNCVIDCRKAGRAFIFQNGETQRTVLSGFTIINGYARGDGGAILCSAAGPNLNNLVIKANVCTGAGGGICVREGEARISNVIFADNRARQGGAIYSGGGAKSVIVNCTVISNFGDSGGGCYFDEGEVKLSNSILWDNEVLSDSSDDALTGVLLQAVSPGSQIVAGSKAAVQVQNCNVEYDKAGATVAGDASLGWDMTNFAVNPCFTLPDDFHLLPYSPCVDTGSNDPQGGLPPDDLEGAARKLDGDGNGDARADMGAFERNPQKAAIALSPQEIHVVLDGTTAVQPHKIKIRNCGGGTLAYKIAEDCPWLEVSAAQGESTGEIDEIALEIDSSRLKHGSHSASLNISAENAANSPRTLSMIVQVTGAMRVPQEYPTIQEAVDAAIDGDTITVADGTYTGPSNRNIDFGGKAITLRSENGAYKCIIDCEGKGRAFYFHNNEPRAAVVEGFTIRNGYTQPTWPELSFGGGIACESASPTIIRNIITGNHGSGISCMGASSPDIRNNMIVDNIADWGGCGIYADQGSSPIIVNCTIANNPGGGIRAWMATAKATNCIIWGNGEDVGGAVVRYSCVQDATPGEGNISGYPYFADAPNGDYRLKSYSPCIDAGDNSVLEPNDRDLEGDGRQSYRFVDMGADEKAFVSADRENNGIGDELPDDWESFYLGDTSSGPWGDPDGDMRTNKQEYAAGTDPGKNQQTIYVSAANGGDRLADGSYNHPFATIQQGINAATAAVLVCEGKYYERLTVDGKTLDIKGGYDATFNERDPQKHKTIIDAGGIFRGVTFVGVEGGSLSGFTITGGNAYNGGAVCCALSSTRITGNVLTGNQAECGGAVECGWKSEPVLENNIIYANKARRYGGAIYAWGQANAAVANCTLYGNTAAQNGGAVCSAEGAAVHIANCIFWENGKTAEIAVLQPAAANIIFSSVSGGKKGLFADGEEAALVWGSGSKKMNPLFADPEAGNFHLQSQFGRFDPKTGEWIKDDTTSPCIDAGDKQSDYSLEPAPNGSRINLGAWGGTAEASRSKE